MKPKKLYRYVHSFADRHGHVRNYFRRGGDRVPLPSQIGSPEFDLAYTTARNQPPSAPASSLPGGIVAKRNGQNPNAVQPLIGVYLLLRKGRITYIGSSLNMPRRVADHRANGRQFDQAFYIATAGNQREALERTMIRTFNPAENRRHRSNGADGDEAREQTV